MTPLTDRVLIAVDPERTKTDSGLYIQEDWKTLPPFGTVKEIGPDVTQVKPGDRVVFERYSAVKLEKDLRMCLESNILAIINE